jgi:hypothetical protein
MNKFKEGYIYTINAEIIAFVIWKVVIPPREIPCVIPRETQSDDLDCEGEPSKYLFINLLCSKQTEHKLGNTLLYDVDSYCVSNKIPFIRINPVSDEIEKYYRLFGYRTLNVIKPKTMSKPIIDLLLPAESISVKRRGKTLSEKDKRLIKYYAENGERIEKMLYDNKNEIMANYNFIRKLQ